MPKDEKRNGKRNFGHLIQYNLRWKLIIWTVLEFARVPIAMVEKGKILTGTHIAVISYRETRVWRHQIKSTEFWRCVTRYKYILRDTRHLTHTHRHWNNAALYRFTWKSWVFHAITQASQIRRIRAVGSHYSLLNLSRVLGGPLVFAIPRDNLQRIEKPTMRARARAVKNHLKASRPLKRDPCRLRGRQHAKPTAAGVLSVAGMM